MNGRVNLPSISKNYRMFQFNKCCSFSYGGDLSWINFRGDWGNEKDGCYPVLLGITNFFKIMNLYICIELNKQEIASLEEDLGNRFKFIFKTTIFLNFYVFQWSTQRRRFSTPWIKRVFLQWIQPNKATNEYSSFNWIKKN